MILLYIVFTFYKKYFLDTYINNNKFVFKISEVNVINEYESYLLSLVHEIGLKLRCSATCTALRCIRYSSFNINQALLMKHWNLQYVLDNIKECNSSYDKINHLSAFVAEQSQLETNQNMTSV
jgi:tRNA U55 pseudouridine synthase TruB